jgi:hypothetical protein
LLYIKPSILPDMPLDAQAYANVRDSFPHETTADQWFSEKFESYRSLGYYQIDGVVTLTGGNSSVGDLLRAASRATLPPAKGSTQRRLDQRRLVLA